MLGNSFFILVNRVVCDFEFFYANNLQFFKASFLLNFLESFQSILYCISVLLLFGLHNNSKAIRKQIEIKSCMLSNNSYVSTFYVEFLY